MISKQLNDLVMQWTTCRQIRPQRTEAANIYEKVQRVESRLVSDVRWTS